MASKKEPTAESGATAPKASEPPAKAKAISAPAKATTGMADSRRPDGRPRERFIGKDGKGRAVAMGAVSARNIKTGNVHKWLDDGDDPNTGEPNQHRAQIQRNFKLRTHDPKLFPEKSCYVFVADDTETANMLSGHLGVHVQHMDERHTKAMRENIEKANHERERAAAEAKQKTRLDFAANVQSLDVVERFENGQ